MNADHLDIVVWWLERWDNRYTSSAFHDFLWGLFDILFDGHRPDLWMRFAPVYGERRDLLDVLNRRALQKSLLDTEWEWFVMRSATELARFTAYRNTSNHVLARQAIASIRTESQADSAMRAVWLRVVAWLHYIDQAGSDCGIYETCHFYEGEGFNTNFREAVLSRRLDCPRNFCPNESITIQSQALSDDQLELACERLHSYSRAFHEMFGTNCEPVANDFNNHLNIHVFRDGLSCEDFQHGVFYFDVDSCSGLFAEANPENRDQHSGIVATEYEPRENPPDPLLSIWNFEHEYAHYLDARYNRHGHLDYRDSLHWWLEGFADYFAAEVSPYIDIPSCYTANSLADILLHSDSIPTSYRERHLAVRFFMENQREFVESVLGYMRRGDYDGYEAFLERAAATIPMRLKHG